VKFELRLLLSGLLLLGCSRSTQPAHEKDDNDLNATPPAPPRAHDDEPAHEPLPTHLRLDPQVLLDAKVELAPVTKEALAATLDLPGEVASDPDKTARVSPLVDGRLESISFKEGQEVKKGDVLAVMKVPELGKAKAAYAASAAKSLAARANADRLQALADKQLAPSQEVLSAKSEAQALEAESRAAEEQLRALGTAASATGVGSLLPLCAPTSGVIVSRDAVVGQAVTAQQTLAVVADLREVWFLARVFEDNLEQVRLGAPAEVRLNAYPRETFDGKIEYLGKQIDPTARTVVARIRLENRGDLLRLGLFGVARVAGTGSDAQRAETLVVPRSAVTEIGRQVVVFVRQPDGDFDLHAVVLGQSALGKVQVLSGVREGEQVVVAGVFTLKSILLKSTFQADD
jgi:cobalt-zinc-cadmium efflux system membrane fusion protein